MESAPVSLHAVRSLYLGATSSCLHCSKSLTSVVHPVTCQDVAPLGNAFKSLASGLCELAVVILQFITLLSLKEEL